MPRGTPVVELPSMGSVRRHLESNPKTIFLTYETNNSNQ
jgi:hypothetical protein